jgi:hypothetical protein
VAVRKDSGGPFVLVAIPAASTTRATSAVRVQERFGVTAREYARDLRHAAQKLDCLADGEVLFVFLILPGAMTALGFRNE